MRRTPLKRSTKPIRRSAIKKRGPTKTETERKYGSQEFRAWIHRLPCQLCGIVGFTQQAHVGKHPMGKKLDWTHTTALCGPFAISADHGRAEPKLVEGCHARFDQKKLDAHQVQRITDSVARVQAEWQERVA